MESFSVQGENIDVSKIMQKVKQRIDNKKQQGIYSDEELAEVTRLRLETLADEVDIDSNLIEHLRSSSAIWNISPDYQIKSHRKGLSIFIVFLKKLIRPVIRLYTDHIVKRQAQLNLYTIHIVHNLVSEITKLQIENKKIKNRLDQVDRSHRFNNQRFKSREKSVDATKPQGKRKNIDPKKRDPNFRQRRPNR
ncbi:MAG: hypothetical protein A2161_05515 [Candidatus Schekmanbacteria bacterium RBG_13_48_7]|uniref:Uncharacterized protein n=1 Tax=Candidatus Schekmanbacteria bacterium RBG_13_48_7 TaxID=1817878 RepID=A0A1F7S6I0_9BACT|nr:MAG: hypothetical protein A2161_05515 [Candidatus Schekmanbacteria bacterium RBG_13_48_7]